MAKTKTRVAAVDGWFTLDDPPRLLANRCTRCSTFVFPPTAAFCPNPACDGAEFEAVPLSGRGRVWSYTINRYQPPPPYISPEPFAPYGIAAVELAEEKLVVLGQVAGDAELRIGTEVQVVLDTLYEDDDHTYVVWKWSPA